MANATLRPNYITVDGVLFPPFPVDCIKETLSYKPKPDDIFIATYPKCGTTWMQNIVLSIFRKGKELQKHEDFQTFSPFIDCKGMKPIENMPRPGAFKTHLPYTHVPYSPEAKYIYVLRNPKDCCVSMYYHTIRAHASVYKDATFDDFFEIFMAGEVEYNDYFDHLMSWYPHRNDKQVLFTTYEDMKNNVKGVILKVAAFLGQEYIDAIHKDNSILDNILRLTGFDYMKKHNIQFSMNRSECKRQENKNNHKEKLAESKEKVSEQPRPEFIRRGIVGDWKNHFSTEQSERINKKFTERLQGTEIYDMYKPYIYA